MLVQITPRRHKNTKRKRGGGFACVCVCVCESVCVGRSIHKWDPHTQSHVSIPKGGGENETL